MCYIITPKHCATFGIFASCNAGIWKGIWGGGVGSTRYVPKPATGGMHRAGSSLEEDSSVRRGEEWNQGGQWLVSVASSW